jgi:putative Mn2+ efflux pump MntP
VPLLKVLVLALSLALDVFAVSIGVGMRGVDRWVKVRIGIAFAMAEVVMNLVGAGLGAVVGHLIGNVAGYLGFIALILVGVYMIYESRKEAANPIDMSRGWGLFVAALSISLDSLGIGFSILYVGVPVALSLTIIAIVSVLATTFGLALGRFLGHRIEELAELLAGVVLALTGIVFVALKLLHVG